MEIFIGRQLIVQSIVPLPGTIHCKSFNCRQPTGRSPPRKQLRRHLHLLPASEMQMVLMARHRGQRAY